MITTLNINLSFMQDIVKNLADNTRMTQDKDEGSLLNFNISPGDADRGIFSRKSSGQYEENNKIRQSLINSLKTQFNVKNLDDLPAGVKHALKLDSWHDDFKLDSNGNVTSGRPLTARRIKAVVKAVNDVLNANKGINNAWKTLSNQAEIEHKQPKQAVFDYFVDKIYTIPNQTLNIFEDGIDSDVFCSFGNNIFKFEQSLYKNMPELVSNAVDGGDGEIWRNVITDIIIGRLSEESRLELKSYVNSNECLEMIRNKYEDINTSNYSDQEFREINGELDYMAMIRISICNFYNVKPLDI